MDLEENSIKDPLDFAANLTIASITHTLDGFRQRKEQKEFNYKAKLNRFNELKSRGETDPNFDFDPDFCEECGDDMPQERKDNYEVLCTLCKTAQEKVERSRGRT